MKPKINSAPTLVEGLILELEQWAGLDREMLIYHLADSQDLALS